MEIRIALAGNPNCGKTTLFNEITGSTQYVGNWPGVTVEKKDGRFKDDKNIIIEDLPGIYSLSPYSLEEVVSRNYLINEKPDAVINIADATNIERNLYLTTQLLETGLPMVIALNMMDLIKKNGDRIDADVLSSELGCEIIEISALKGKGCKEAVLKAVQTAKEKNKAVRPCIFTGSTEHAIAHIEESIAPFADESEVRWYAIKLFERDKKVQEMLALPAGLCKHIEQHIKDCEEEMDDDSESIITNQRYEYIAKLIDRAIVKKKKAGNMSVSDRIDSVVTNRILAIPIFALIIWLMYYISITTLGGKMDDWVNDVLFGTWIGPGTTSWLTGIGAPDWLISLITDGIIGGVGTVLGFVPQMLLIFFFLAVLEDSGYMARVAFIMDRMFRRFGLSGKSFIPILIGTGCGVPAIMAARTIESERDRRMTIMLAPFMPCTAKTVIIAMIVSTFFPGSKWIAPSMYFLGIAVIVFSGIALKKTKTFEGEPAPFVMELPAYHIPSLRGVLIHMWERAKAFIIKAGTIIFSACVIIWLLSTFSWSFQMAGIENSMLAGIGRAFAWLFVPLGFGTWKGAVAVISAEMAKEQAIGTLGVLAGLSADASDSVISTGIAVMFSSMGAFSFMILNLFDPPCVVAMATTLREMGNKKWGWQAIGYQCITGYVLAFIIYQFGNCFIYGAPFGAGQIAATVVTAAIVYFIARPASKTSKKEMN